MEIELVVFVLSNKSVYLLLATFQQELRRIRQPNEYTKENDRHRYQHQRHGEVIEITAGRITENDARIETELQHTAKLTANAT